MHVGVNEELCTGCGLCEDICPEVFNIDNNISRVLVETVPAEVEDSCKDAMEQCPTDAISIEE